MNVVSLHLHADTGNQIVQYLHARAYAEKHNCELQLSNIAYRAPKGTGWIGEAVFGIKLPWATQQLPRRTDPDGESPLVGGEVNICLDGYRQYQDAMIYTAAQARKWLRIRPDLYAELQAKVAPSSCVVAHVRYGDFIQHGMVVVSRSSYVYAARKFGFDVNDLVMIEQGTANTREQMADPELGFLADWYRLIKAPVLFRSNSTYAFTAGIFSTGRVFSPIIAGKNKRIASDCDFAKGNGQPIWEGSDGLNRSLILPEEKFTSYSQAAQDIFVHQVIVRPEGKLDGTFLDIGAHHPTSLSNTYALEQLGWSGWLIEREDSYAELLRAQRKSSVIQQDAREVDWLNLDLPSVVDYLSLDVDEASLEVLRKLPLKHTQFRVITAEHNLYAYDSMRGPMREILERHGYFMVCGDVKFGGNAFEDWWVHPSLVDVNAVAEFVCDNTEASEIFQCV